MGHRDLQLEPGEHMRRKRESYWADLTAGETGRYKTQQVVSLLAGRSLPTASSVVDIGAGTSDLSSLVADIGGVEHIVCVDYDPAVVAEREAREANPRVTWRVADARDIARLGAAPGAVTFFDVLHEVYSFVGRDESTGRVDHEIGIAAVQEALDSAIGALAPGGIIVITDDVLPDEHVVVVVRAKNALSADTVRLLQTDYPSCDLEIAWRDAWIFEMPSRRLVTLLTQYNKPKRGDMDRWLVEQMEVHEYMSASELRSFFEERGMHVDIDVGTPELARQEWEADFEILQGLPDLPEKRVALVAQK